MSNNEWCAARGGGAKLPGANWPRPVYTVLRMSANGNDLLARVSGLLDALNCGAALVDRTGKLVHINGRLSSMMQRDCADIRGHNLLEFYSDPDDRAKLEARLIRFEPTTEAEFYLPLPNGERLPVISSSRNLPGDEHRVVTLIDISRQKDAENSLREHYKFIVEMSDTVLQQALDLKHYSKELEQRVKERTADLHAANMDAIYMLAEAAEAKDHDTGRHVRRIQAYSRALALQLGLNDSDAEEIGYSAILHDVGKLHVPDRILAKPGPLNSDERQEMQEHTIVGEKILSPRKFFAQSRQIARSHHENWDGSGYPDHLDGQHIPAAARIVHIVDVYDALTSKRIYKEAWAAERASEFISEQAGQMFDPEMSTAFNSLMNKPDGDPAHES
jgi:putative nucleotidyltransferase with HDIG domain